MGGLWVVSRCLLGGSCRYDGKSKVNAAVQSRLSELGCQVLELCPELDCGLGCPRLPMELHEVEGRVRALDREGHDCTPALESWIGETLSRLEQLKPSGFILKSRSPSCGLGDVPIHGREHPGDGLFAAALRLRFPGCALLRECDLPGGREPLSPEKLLRRAESCARLLLERSPSCHDWDHTLRVWRNVQRLMRLSCELEPERRYDGLAAEVAAVLHDIGRPRELSDCGATNHATYGAELVREWLPALGVADFSFVELVSECVRTHRYRRREGSGIPTSFEGQLVYDGDKLDSIGAIGIGRSFHFAGRVGARVHNRAEEALGSSSYSREDSAYREYLVKLRHVSSHMLTRAGRQLAESRHDFMVSFFAELNRECYGES